MGCTNLYPADPQEPLPFPSLRGRSVRTPRNLPGPRRGGAPVPALNGSGHSPPRRGRNQTQEDTRHGTPYGEATAWLQACGRDPGAGGSGGRAGPRLLASSPQTELHITP